LEFSKTVLVEASTAFSRNRLEARWTSAAAFWDANAIMRDGCGD
jgi:hypothetical protein